MTKDKKSEFTPRSFKPKTPNQEEYVRTIVENEIIFCTGPAGSGKSACATGLACSYLRSKKVDRIIITRPIVESGESLGFLPGDLSEKVGPYMRPIQEELRNYFSYSELNALFNNTTGQDNQRIEVIPFAYMRGLSFHNAFIIADECQNATESQLKMLITRLGWNSKLVINGDITQSDLPKSEQGALEECLIKLNGILGVGLCHLTQYDIIRNPLIGKVLARWN